VGVSKKIKQYVSGILLLLLATFIIASVIYITSIIPETTIPSDSTSTNTNPYLVYSTSVNVNNAYLISVDFSPSFSYTAQYKLYLVIDTTDLNPPAKPSSITITYNTLQSYPTIYQFNETIYYCNLTGYSGIDTIRVFLNTTTSGILIISFYDTDDINQAITWSPPATSGSAISNKLILNFIGWIAGIILVIDALRKFDIPI
jgi:hypothetical protein